MIVVLDVSAAIEILLKKEKRELLNKTYKEASWVMAPDLYVSEISNVFWKYFKAKAISRDDCVSFVEDGINMVDGYVDARELWKEALGEGIKNNHPIYDMYYSVLARRNNATLLTNDGQLLKICKKLNISICH